MSVNIERGGPAVAVTIGFAAAPNGRGAAFAAIGDTGAGRVVRVPFSLTVRPALRGRDVAYAAAAAVLGTLRRRGLRRVEVRLEDARLVNDLAERSALPAPLTVLYVTLRCKLNCFAEARVDVARNELSRDLTARAAADVSLQVAA